MDTASALAPPPPPSGGPAPLPPPASPAAPHGDVAPQHVAPIVPPSLPPLVLPTACVPPTPAPAPVLAPAPSPLAAPAAAPVLAPVAPSLPPSLPTLAPAPPAPVVSMPIEATPSFDDTAAAYPTSPLSAAEMFAEPADEVDDEPVPEQQQLIGTRWLRIIAMVGFAVVPFINWTITSALPLAAVGISLIPLLALMVWSGLTAMNAGRARPATAHQSPPRPIWAAASWLLAPVLAFPGIALLYRLDNWVESGTFDQEGERSIMFIGGVLVFAVIMLWAITRPYLVLAQASRWVSGDGDKFRRWFFAPLMVLAGCVVIAFFAGLATASTSADGDVSLGPATLAVGMAIAAAVLPWLTWLVVGTKAMIDIDEAIGHQHRRRSTEEPAVTPMNPLLAAQTPAGPAASHSF